MPMPRRLVPKMMPVAMKPVRVNEKQQSRHNQSHGLQESPVPQSMGLLVSAKECDFAVDFRPLLV